MPTTDCGHDLEPGRHVVHTLPGRVRLRFSACCREDAQRLASRLSNHPAVQRVRWRDSIQSMTVYFDPDHSFADITATLPPDDGTSRIDIVDSPQIDWRRVAISCALSMLPLGPAGNLALTLVMALHEEMERTRAMPQPPPRLSNAARLPIG